VIAFAIDRMIPNGYLQAVVFCREPFPGRPVPRSHRVKRMEALYSALLILPAIALAAIVLAHACRWFDHTVTAKQKRK